MKKIIETYIGFVVLLFILAAIVYGDKALTQEDCEPTNPNHPIWCRK